MTEADRLTIARTLVVRLRRLANGRGRIMRQELRDIADALDLALIGPSVVQQLARGGGVHEQ